MLQPKNVCRCCLSGGCYKDIATEYYWSGQKEVYADMLLQTFNLTISHQEGAGPSSGSRLICDSCIVKLREATLFKSRVQEVERNIIKHLTQWQNNENVLETLQELKVEKLQYDSLDDEEYSLLGDNYADDIHEDDEQLTTVTSDLDLKDEIDDDAMDNYNTEQGELFMIKMLPTRNKKEEKMKVKKINSEKSKKALAEQIVPKKKTLSKKEAQTDKRKSNDSTIQRRRPLKTPIAELKMRENTVKLALNSNMCLFKSLRIKYQCFYCKERYFDIKQLKDHTKEHQCNKEKSLKIGRASSFKNAEITNLTCNLCTQSCSDIDNLKEHLTSNHEIAFEPEGHLLVPYKIENDLKCVLCDDKFNTFTRLLIHMNKHYTNHVCESCGGSFINKVSLRIHVASLHKERKCNFCQAVFSTTSARYKHIIKMHDPTKRSKRYCYTCNTTFKYTYMLYEHRIQEHGKQRQTASCTECNKTFISLNNLKLHIRSVHLKERNYPCTYCTMRFFTSTDQKRHEKTHGVTEADLFMCSYCDTKFKSKDSWRRHVNKQHAKF